jgi:hypothetical protein
MWGSKSVGDLVGPRIERKTRLELKVDGHPVCLWFRIHEESGDVLIGMEEIRTDGTLLNLLVSKLLNESELVADEGEPEILGASELLYEQPGMSVTAVGPDTLQADIGRMVPSGPWKTRPNP